MQRTRQIIARLGMALGLTVAALSFASTRDTAMVQALVRAYPEQLAPTEKPNTVLWKDGTEMVFDDGVRKTDFDEILNRASLKDQMAMAYPQAWPVAPPPTNGDPGRVRNEAFFRKMYGDSAQQVEANLVDVEWLGGARVRFTEVNGAAEALRQVRKELDTFPAEVRRLVSTPMGTFLWRPISGTTRLSMHSFGAAIDFQLPPRAHRYWRWDSPAAKGTPAYPVSILCDARLKQIVEVFERHGFIWGGKWFHYDTMHFEYRPELRQ